MGPDGREGLNTLKVIAAIKRFSTSGTMVMLDDGAAS